MALRAPRGLCFRPSWAPVLAIGAWLLCPCQAAADVFLLRSGDRISGKTLSTEADAFTVLTPYGQLRIPRSEIERIVFGDGREERLRGAPGSAATARLILLITGHSFWYAWDLEARGGGDPTLRLELRVGEATVAVYTDRVQDPQDLSGAVVNTFSFEPGVLDFEASGGAIVLAPEVRPGKATAKLDLPSETAGEQRLELAYQVNEGSASQPAWRDAASTAVWIELRTDRPAYVNISQDQGQMEFAGFRGRRMKNVESFRISARPETPATRP